MIVENTRSISRLQQSNEPATFSEEGSVLLHHFLVEEDMAVNFERVICPHDAEAGLLHDLNT